MISDEQLDLLYTDECVSAVKYPVVKELIEARKRIAELEARNRWIPVSERLPDPETYVLAVRNNNEVVRDMAFINDENCWVTDCGFLEGDLFGDSDGNVVTHWMPLPDAPEVEK